MSEAKIDENIRTQSLVENGDKEDEERNNSVSDGEIVDDDDPPVEEKSVAISFPHRKITKNFRSRNEKSDSDETESKSDKKKGITDGELKNLKSHLNNGDMDNSTLENFRKKIIDELGRKEGSKQMNATRNFESHRGMRTERGGARRNFNDQNRRFTQNGRGNRHSFQDRDRNLNRNREKFQSRVAGPDEIKIFGEKRPLFFPKNIIKHTKTIPSISYSENPNSLRTKNERTREDKGKKDREKKKENSLNDKMNSSAEVKDGKIEKSSESPAKIVNVASKEIDKLKVKTETISTKVKSEQAAEKLNIKDSFKSPTKLHISPEKLKTIEKVEQKSPEKINKIKFDANSLIENIKSDRKLCEKLKVELKIERKKSPKRIEKPKVNIFLEDSDEVDEFEKNAMIEVKSKWSSPEIKKEVEKLPTIVPAPIVEFKPNIPGIPVVVESPERSPVVPLTENIFESSSSMLVEKSPTPSPPPKPSKVRNVCSFLSDIASGSMFSGLGFGSGLYDEDNGLKEESLLKLPELKKREVNKLDIDITMEPDTTADKVVEQTLGKLSKSSDDDSDSDDSDSSSSSDSDSDDTTSESEESSEESSDEDVPSFTRGFGRFDASMPMVTQIKPSTISNTATTPAINVASRFQPQPNLIKPPVILGKSTLYQQAVIQPLPTAATPFPQFQFPIPFKIYSLRDVNNAVAFPTPPQQLPPVVAVTSSPITEKADKEKKQEEKSSEKRERKRSRSHSRDRDRKRSKDERKKTPPRRRSPSPAKKRHVDDRRQSDSRRKDSRISHGSRHSPIRRQRKSRSRSPQRNRSPIARPRTPPQRPRTPPSKIRRSPPTRRSSSRSPPSKFRRSSSPGARRNRSPSPGFRRSPRRRYSPNSARNRRSPSPYRYDRRSLSPTFRNKMDSPNGYKPDSTISDTELERQQYMQEEFYLSQWNNTNSSPKRPNLDDRIHRMLSDSPTHNSSSNAQQNYQHDGYPYQIQHDNQSGMFYHDMYNQHQMLPPHNHLQPPPNSMNHHGSYSNEFNNFSSPRNFVNNSNLVEITQQKRKARSSQAVQVGNVLEIVPNTKIVTPTDYEVSKNSTDKSESLTTEEVRHRAERSNQLKLKRKVDRERKRTAKHLRKEKLRQEIQRYFDSGVTVDYSDDESLVSLRAVNVGATPAQSIIKTAKSDASNNKKVLFSDGILPGETTSEDDDETSQVAKNRRKKFRKKRLMQLIKTQIVNNPKDLTESVNDLEVEKGPPPSAPVDVPPAHLQQPRLKKITVEMFAAFPVNPEPIYYFYQKLQQTQQHSYQTAPPQRLNNDRFHYYKKQPPPNVAQSPVYMQQQRGAISKPNSVSSLDPRINQQRPAEKAFS